ncbi:MAG: hypothetical protein ACKOHJ_01355 [Vulcanococcus sp.]
MRGWAGLLILVAAAPLQAVEQGFGRWQQEVSQCVLQLESRRIERCQGLRLDQRNEAVLRLSVLAPSPEPGLAQELTFVGELDPGSAPMRCNDGVCQVEAPMRLALTVVRSAQFNGRGLVVGYPQTTPASGRCELSKTQVTCRAESSTGQLWSAQLNLR